MAKLPYHPGNPAPPPVPRRDPDITPLRDGSRAAFADPIIEADFGFPSPAETPEIPHPPTGPTPARPPSPSPPPLPENPEADPVGAEGDPIQIEWGDTWPTAEEDARNQPRPVIRGLLDEGEKLILGGGSKSKKTWSLMDLALAATHGADWFGWPCTVSNVIYVNLELKPIRFRERMRAIVKARDLGITPRLGVVNLRGQPLHLGTVALRLRERLEAADVRAGLVIIDPVYKALQGRDENAASEIAQMLQQLDEFMSVAGGALVLAHHFPKGDATEKDPLDRISGSGVFGRDLDSLVTITPAEGDEAYLVDSVSRNNPPRPRFGVRFRFPIFVRDAEVTEYRKPGAKPKYDRGEVLKVVQALCDTQGGWTQFTPIWEAVQELGIRRKQTFVDLLGGLVESGKVERKQEGRSSYYRPLIR